MSALTAEKASSTFVLPSRLDAMAGARLWLDGHAAEAGFDHTVTSELELALTEALSNVIRHAYNCADGNEIVVTAEVDDDALTLTVRDFGAKFDRSAYQPVDLDVPTVGGYGVYFIETVMDDVAWDTSPAQGTLLRMVKFRPGRRR